MSRSPAGRAPVPVIVGVAQLLQRGDDPAEAREPLELMVDAVRRAAEDAGSRELLARADAVRVVRGVWRYGDPGRVVARRVGCPGARTGLTHFGGQAVQSLASRTFLDLQRGDLEVAILCGAECGRSRAQRKAGAPAADWSEAPGTPDESLGQALTLSHDAELARGIRLPIQLYAMFETALRHAGGEAVEAHLDRIARLWAGFSAVASGNPSAWLREPRSAEEIRTPGPGNRPVSFPYPMLMTSNPRVDMGAALILTHEALAERLGVPRERWVYPHAASDAQDPIFASEREEFFASPAIRRAGGRALELAGVEPKALGHRDLYSCFPSAVQVAARELGLDETLPLTVTGGLTFAGGPMNNYTMHGIARMVEVLRADPGARGLVSGNGGYLSKHAFGVYSSEPPERPFRHADLNAEGPAPAARAVTLAHAGPVAIEAYCVAYDDDGRPVQGHAACRLADGRRSWGQVVDPDAAAAMTREEFCGRSASLGPDGTLEVR